MSRKSALDHRSANERPVSPLCGCPADPAMEVPHLDERLALALADARPIPPWKCPRPSLMMLVDGAPPGEKSALIDSGELPIGLTTLSAANPPFIAHSGMAVRMTRP
jgi:hypothetical protein